MWVDREKLKNCTVVNIKFNYLDDEHLSCYLLVFENVILFFVVSITNLLNWRFYCSILTF